MKEEQSVGVGPDPDSQRQQGFLIVILGVLSLGTVLDLIFDKPDNLLSLHVLFEVLLATAGVSAVVYFWMRLRRAGEDLQRSRAQAHAHSQERDHWRGRALKLLTGLGVEIDTQLREWGLSPVERETALMLLKGLEHKEIAALQGKSERTVRQHAISVYRKSGLSGRAELSAFFLEDLLLPAADAAEID